MRFHASIYPIWVGSSCYAMRSEWSGAVKAIWNGIMLAGSDETVTVDGIDVPLHANQSVA